MDRTKGSGFRLTSLYDEPSTPQHSILRVLQPPASPCIANISGAEVLDPGCFGDLSPRSFTPPKPSSLIHVCCCDYVYPVCNVRFLPQFQRTVRFLKSGQLEQHALYRKLVNERRERARNTSQDSDNTDNFIDAFLEAGGPEDIYSETQLIYLLADLFGAGLDTTVTTLRWFVLAMAAYPEHQENVRRELETLGGRVPTYEDSASLPYTQAAIAEIQRLRPVTPLGIPHGAVEDCEINGFLVPKGSMFIPLLWAIHLDPKRWSDPQRYDPNRFIGFDGGFLRPDGFMPFQIGKRMCVGDEWARLMLFLFGASIVQKFKISKEPGKEISLEGEVGITLTPKDQKLVFTPLVQKKA